MTDKSMQQFASIAMRYLDEQGREKNSSESMVHDTGLAPPLSLDQRIKRMMASEKQMAYAMHQNPSDDENDFDEDDDEFLTPYEVDGSEYVPESPPEPPVVSDTPPPEKKADKQKQASDVSADASLPPTDKSDGQT